MPRKSNKREQLLNAADFLFLKKGIELTTLANIASLAEVPLGNVYYYFKTKKEMVRAILKLRCTALESLLNNIEQQHTEPASQIKALIEMFLNINQQEEQTMGALITALWQDLAKNNPKLLEDFLPLPNLVLDWCTKRFAALGKNNNSREYSVGLLAAMQGLLVMNNDSEKLEHFPAQVKLIENTFGLAS